MTPVLPVPFLGVDFLLCFLVLVVSVLCLAGAVFAGGLAGVWAANVRGMVATANAIVARIVFFMIFFSPLRALPAYNPIMRPIAK